MRLLHWLWLRWRADHFRTLSFRAFADGRRYRLLAEDCDARADAINAGREANDA